jgi:uncharacterized SAM-binding protein YcdF (DUF218 family)
MFFVASKIFAFVTVPSNLLIALVILGTLLLFTPLARAGRRLIVVALALVVIVGVSPLGLALLQVLEQRFPAWNEVGAEPTGFVILGGAIEPDASVARGTPVLDGSAERVTIAADLARRFPSAKFLYSGGNGTLDGGAAEADHALALLASFGVPRERVLLERSSRNTAENAEFSKLLAQPKAGERWVLVTTGTHMPRAIGAFRAVGFEVEAFPVDWRTRGPDAALAFSPVFLAGLSALDAAAREFVGLVTYRLAGQTSELFPAPR